MNGIHTNLLNKLDQKSEKKKNIHKDTQTDKQTVR